MARSKTKVNQWDSHRQTLLKKQREMLDSFARDRAAGNTQPDDGIQDLADKAASAYAKELNFSLSDAEREILVQIEDALERIAGNGYGTCTNCGATIGGKRLHAIPWSTFCIDCQELHEQSLL